MFKSYAVTTYVNDKLCAANLHDTFDNALKSACTTMTLTRDTDIRVRTHIHCVTACDDKTQFAALAVKLIARKFDMKNNSAYEVEEIVICL